MVLRQRERGRFPSLPWGRASGAQKTAHTSLCGACHWQAGTDLLGHSQSPDEQPLRVVCGTAGRRAAEPGSQIAVYGCDICCIQGASGSCWGAGLG